VAIVAAREGVACVQDGAVSCRAADPLVRHRRPLLATCSVCVRRGRSSLR